jgi:hypothetical protein
MEPPTALQSQSPVDTANELLAEALMSLYHRGLKKASGRSLMEEKKQQYDALLSLQQIRHNVAHIGYKPTFDEAQKGHRLCCEVLQWLARVGGYPVKPLLSNPADSSSGIVASVAACSLTVPTPKNA